MKEVELKVKITYHPDVYILSAPEFGDEYAERTTMEEAFGSLWEKLKETYDCYKDAPDSMLTLDAIEMRDRLRNLLEEE